MAAGQAIKTKAEIQRVSDFILKHFGTDMQDFFRLGLNLALRVSDELSITRSEATTALESDYLVIQEKKTATRKGVKTNKAPRRIKLNIVARDIISQRLAGDLEHHFLFQSQSKNLTTDEPRHYSRQYVYQVFKDAGEVIGRHLSTHSMRKTRGYMLYQQGVPIETICKMFNHSHVSVTLRYIGIEQEEIDVTYEELVL